MNGLGNMTPRSRPNAEELAGADVVATAPGKLCISGRSQISLLLEEDIPVVEFPRDLSVDADDICLSGGGGDRIAVRERSQAAAREVAPPPLR